MGRAAWVAGNIFTVACTPLTYQIGALVVDLASGANVTLLNHTAWAAGGTNDETLMADNGNNSFLASLIIWACVPGDCLPGPHRHRVRGEKRQWYHQPSQHQQHYRHMLLSGRRRRGRNGHGRQYVACDQQRQRRTHCVRRPAHVRPARACLILPPARIAGASTGQSIIGQLQLGSGATFDLVNQRHQASAVISDRTSMFVADSGNNRVLAFS